MKDRPVLLTTPIEGQTLTRREFEVADLVYLGLANKVIATRLGVVEGTIKIHLHNIYRKLRVSNRTGLLRVLGTKIAIVEKNAA
jgi:DNA-binding NarL/FixJ family response regulator